MPGFFAGDPLALSGGEPLAPLLEQEGQAGGVVLVAQAAAQSRCVGLGVPAARHGLGGGTDATARRAWAPVHGLAARKARVARLDIAVVIAL